MDASEDLVRQYLQSRGYTDVVYEPDGNVPPDFLVNGRIAVEVRRLNQNHIDAQGDVHGLEEAFFPLWHRLQHFLPTVGPSDPSESWYVGVRFRRPVESWREIETKLVPVLREFIEFPERRPRAVQLTQHVSIDFAKAGKTYPSVFRLGGGADRDSGGFVLSETRRNLALCIAEKERKIQAHRHRYPEWWLVLPNHIGLHMSQEDLETFREMPPLAHSWNKIILINPLHPASGVEV